MPRRRSLRSFLAGSLLGGTLVVVARRRRGPESQGLAAFESAPCHRATADGRLPADQAAHHAANGAPSRSGRQA